MKDFRLINEAQKAKDAAAARARELAEQASGVAEDVKAKASDVKEQIAEQAAGMNEMGLAKLNETLVDFKAALPALREAGYTLDGVNIDLGVPPKIVANFSGGGSAPDEKIEALLEENAERSLTVLLVKSVQQAAKLQSMLNIKGMKPRGLSVEIACSKDCCEIRLGVALPELRNCLTFLTPFLSKCFPCFPWLVNPLPQWREPMDLNIRIIHARDFLKTTPTFEVDLETSKQFFLKLAQENAAPRQYDLLIELRRAIGHLSLADVIEVVQVVIERPDSFRSKIAILTAPGVKLENAQFAAL